MSRKCLGLTSEADLDFASQMVQALNVLVLTSAEALALRSLLRKGVGTAEGAALFEQLRRVRGEAIFKEVKGLSDDRVSALRQAAAAPGAPQVDPAPPAPMGAGRKWGGGGLRPQPPPARGSRLAPEVPGPGGLGRRSPQRMAGGSGGRGSP